MAMSYDEPHRWRETRDPLHNCTNEILQIMSH